MATPSKADLRKAIGEHGGIVSEIARHYGVTRQTLYNWVAKYGLRERINEARVGMRAVAADVIYQRLMDGDPDAAFEAAKFVMTHMKDDGEMLALPPELIEMMSRMGISAAMVIRELSELMKQQYELTLTAGDDELE